MAPRRIVSWSCLALAGVWFSPGGASARAKTDLVYLQNGDRMTGEIKQLDRGILQLSTNDIGTINIEWEDVDSLNSVYQFRVEDRFGEKYFGAIFLTRAGALEVIREGQSSTATQIDVVAITPLEASFWQQLDGSISVGFSFTKSNNLAQLTADINVRRRTPIRLLVLDLNSITTAQEDEDTQRREDFSLTYYRLFESRLFATAAAATQTNDELGLKLRVQVSSGLGANLVQSNHNDLVSAVGLSVNREWSTNSDGGYNLEAFVYGRHSVFRYDYPKTDITTDITIFPSLTSWGRVRSELDISGSREIVSDFTVVLSFYDSYDSDPVNTTAATNDYGIVMSLGWTF
jgi:hypothetical protein